MTDATTEREPAYHLVMVSFQGTDTAAHTHDLRRAEGGFDGCEIEAVALVSRDVDGQVHVHEKGSAGIGAAFGAAAAGLVGLVTGPVLLPILLAVGAVGGGVAGHFAGQVIPTEDLRKVAAALQPGTSALIALVDSRHAWQVAECFGTDGELVVDAPIETELSSSVREAVLHSVRRV
jgi:uncharacterized membrane protein